MERRELNDTFAFCFGKKESIGVRVTKRKGLVDLSYGIAVHPQAWESFFFSSSSGRASTARHAYTRAQRSTTGCCGGHYRRFLHLGTVSMLYIDNTHIFCRLRETRALDLGTIDFCRFLVVQTPTSLMLPAVLPIRLFREVVTTTFRNPHLGGASSSSHISWTCQKREPWKRHSSCTCWLIPREMALAQRSKTCSANCVQNGGFGPATDGRPR